MAWAEDRQQEGEAGLTQRLHLIALALTSIIMLAAILWLAN